MGLHRVSCLWWQLFRGEVNQIQCEKLQKDALQPAPCTAEIHLSPLTPRILAGPQSVTWKPIFLLE